MRTPWSVGAVKEGVYEFTDTSGRQYVGQSVNIPNRLKQHIKSGNLDSSQEVKTTEVLGGKTARELSEHKRIQEITGGVPARFSDKVDPISLNRRHLLE
ncbi:GIY-YIG nuclease family protein [Photobacterium sp. GJ3]|uniref:GIY-YIG nuclease family protein n=1 Tax=Photobacterium sp. GJ3 TaxID=2829502 RepID=UPI001B8AAA93|nr:GIY-YIG nuclease family protein [Photobacterium sp. GJ3]QUJ67374.1 GIY-YIG nuclease family protein [Photobacterium sp. GJ3]